MNKYDFKNLELATAFVSNLLTLAFKLGVLVGGTCLLFYCYRLDYFPVGLSLGDGFLFIILAISFGFIYGTFVAILTSLGLCLVPALIPFQRLVYFFKAHFSKRPLKEPLAIALPNISAIILGLCGIVFIASVYKMDTSLLWSLPATAFLLGVLFSTYQEASRKLSTIVAEEGIKIQPASTNLSSIPFDKNLVQSARTISLVALFVTPLLVGGASGILLEGGMRFANIKKGPSYVMIRAPYNSFVPSEFQSKLSPSAPDFTTFEGIDVMFYGLGQRTVIEYKTNNSAHHLEIPNEYIIVIPR